jgi:hypothetical protein
MAGTTNGQRRLQSAPATFEVVVQGCLDAHWADWLGDPATQVATVGAGARTTILLPVADQVALLGHLQKLTDLGFPLLLVRRTQDANAQGGHDVY